LSVFRDGVLIVALASCTLKGLMAERTAKVAGGHVTVGERVRMRWGAKWAGVVRAISERTPTSGVGYVRVDTDHGRTLVDSALAWEKEG
jgi:hypothetical protein